MPESSIRLFHTISSIEKTIEPGALYALFAVSLVPLSDCEVLDNEDWSRGESSLSFHACYKRGSIVESVVVNKIFLTISFCSSLIGFPLCCFL